MMWKIWHKLFGWDYIVFSFGLADTVRRIRVTPNGKEYVKIISSVVLVNENNKTLESTSGEFKKKFKHLTRITDDS